MTYDVPKFKGGFSPAGYYSELLKVVEKFNENSKHTKIEILKGDPETITNNLRQN